MTRKTGIIVQARTGSSRFPGKVLAEIDGRPMLQCVVERLRRVRGSDAIVVATTPTPSDDPVAALVERLEDVGLWRGPVDDVLTRFCGAAAAFGHDVVGRVTGDCPLIDPSVIGDVLALFDATPECAYASNCRPRSFPHGFDVEIVSRAALEAAGAEARDAFDREHVLVHVFTHPERFRCVNLLAQDPSHAGLRLTVDYPADLELIRALVARLGSRWLDAGMAEIAAVLAREPDLLAINAAVPAHESITDPSQRHQTRQGRPS